MVPDNLTQPAPVPLHLLPGFEPGLDLRLDAENDQDEDESGRLKRERFLAELKRITPWGMKDLTIGSYVKLARMLVLEHKMWHKFSELMRAPFPCGRTTTKTKSMETLTLE